MPTTFLLLIAAPSQLLPERAIRKCLESEVSNQVKVCYVTSQSTPYLSSAQFMASLDDLLGMIREEDWLVVIYSGLYQKLEGGGNKMDGVYRLATPFRDADWLKEEDLALPILQHYKQHHFKTMVILDASREDTELALHHQAWREVPMVALIGQRKGNPERDDENTASLIGCLCGYLLDVETNLLKRQKQYPTIKQAYSSIKQLVDEGHQQMESDQGQSGSDDSDKSSHSSEERIQMRLYYSELGQALLQDKLPL